jgi:hypothetical protein
VGSRGLRRTRRALLLTLVWSESEDEDDEADELPERATAGLVAECSSGEGASDRVAGDFARGGVAITVARDEA